MGHSYDEVWAKRGEALPERHLPVEPERQGELPARPATRVLRTSTKAGSGQLSPFADHSPR